MIPGLTFLGEVPLGVPPLAYNSSTAALFGLLLDQPDIDFLFLVEIHPFAYVQRSLLGLPAPLGLDAWNISAEFTVYDGEADIYLSDRGYRTAPSDTEKPNAYFRPRLARGFSFSASAFSGLDPSSGGTTRGSEIEVINEDGEFDRWAHMGFDDREIKVLAGAPSFAYADFGIVARWNAASIDMKEGLVTINPKDKATIFDRGIQGTLFLGTGGHEGGVDLAGKPKPLAFGLCRNVEGVLVDASIFAYQLHDGSMEGVMACRDKGVALSFSADYTSYATLAAASVPDGSYATCLAEGYGRVGGTPVGKITWDVRGDNAGGYVATAPEIIRRIATTRLGARNLLDPSDIDAVAFAAVTAAHGAICGLYVASDRRVSDCLTELTRCFFGFHFFTRTGALSVASLLQPGTSVNAISEALFGDDGIERLADEPPAWRVLVGYRRIWTPQADVDLAGLVNAADRSLFGQETRYTTHDESGVKGRHRGSKPLIWDTTIDAEADAAALAVAIGDFMAGDPVRLRVPLLRSQLRYWLGDVVTLSTTRVGLGGSFAGIVAAIDEDYQAGTATLELVG